MNLIFNLLLEMTSVLLARNYLNFMPFDLWPNPMFFTNAESFYCSGVALLLSLNLQRRNKNRHMGQTIIVQLENNAYIMDVYSMTLEWSHDKRFHKVCIVFVWIFIIKADRIKMYGWDCTKGCQTIKRD